MGFRLPAKPRIPVVYRASSQHCIKSFAHQRREACRIASLRKILPLSPPLALALATRASLSWNKGYFYFFIYFSLLVYLFIYLFTYFLVGIFLVRIEKFSLFEKNLTETSHSDERKNKKKERKLFVRPSFFHYFHFRTIASIGAGFSIRGEKRERGNGKERESEKWSKEVFLRIAPPLSLFPFR